MIPEKSNRYRRYTDEEILSAIRRTSEARGGRRVTIASLGEREGIACGTVRRHFGSWRQAIEIAGVPLGPGTGTEDECYEDMLKLWAHYGGRPKMSHAGKPPSRIRYYAYYRIWGGWTNAMAAFVQRANLDPDVPADVRSCIQHTYRYPGGKARGNQGVRCADEDILSEIRRVWELTGKYVTKASFDENAIMSSGTVCVHFGRWSQALERAGVPGRMVGKCDSEDEYYQNLLAVWVHYGRRPTRKEMGRAPSEFTYWTYKSRLGNWSKTVTAFLDWVNSDQGLSDEVRAFVNQDNRRIGSRSAKPAPKKKRERLRVQLLHTKKERRPEREYFDNLLALCAHYGRWPKIAEINRPPSQICKGSYQNRWGKWLEAIKAFQSYIDTSPAISADLRLSIKEYLSTPRRNRGRRRYTGEDVLSAILRASDRLGGGSITSTDLWKQERIALNTVYLHFSSFGQAIEKAGLPLGRRQRMYSKDECYQNLLDVWTHYGRQPTNLEMEKPPSKIIKQQYLLHWGTWLKAVDAFLERANNDLAISEEVRLSMSQTRRNRGVLKLASRLINEEVLSEIRRVAGLLDGGMLWRSVFEEHSWMTSSLVCHRFGSWWQALRQAGLPPAMRHGHTDEEFCENLKTVWKYCGFQPGMGRMNKPPSQIKCYGYMRRWGTWKKAVEAFLDWIDSDPSTSDEARALIYKGIPRIGLKSLQPALRAEWERLRMRGLCEPKEG